MSLFVKPKDLKIKKNIAMLIYGQPGLGKSTLALSAPKPVLFDFDGGVQRVNGAFQCPTLQVQSWDEVLVAMEEDLSEFDSIIIDTAGKMLDFMSAYIIKNDVKMKKRDGSLSLQGYGARKTMFINFITRCFMLRKNVIFVAHEREDKDGEIRIVRPEIGGSSAGDLLKELDLVGYMQAIGNERTVFWTPQEKFYAKNTCNLPEAHKVKNIIDAEGNVTAQNNFLTLVFNNYEAYLEKQSKLSTDYDSLVQQINADVDSIKDIDSANAALKKIASYSPIWDSKIRANQLITAKCNSLGLKYNGATKSYESAA